ncbi:MAG: glycoside hydrolase family 2 protein [candidate division KSB1 bacterium]|nr:glycoside hydrolase family 2 protein [candidate division KSB1 bacterium]MDZ7273526.1 glycoside hydrolase family 2 protein [candidate division KSB1 bacterium]MDZ7286883.1 glycoside hydrolase family 2 protein [candidate division KSB1 bacterium]MDZ7299764.1 glycoside hydrolase family 2 protein [candidate division KSB1 bacterium]MDZ7308489.1 glycoside hydrolase family 2 protein [candidate division KSB1 bacterium]
MNTITLNGVWELQPDWHSPRISQLPGGLFTKEEWLPAVVPGTVHTDLLAAGKIPNPFYRDEEERVLWIAEIGWRYRRSFHMPAEFLRQTAVQLVANGLDSFAAIFLNGRLVAETANMFIAHRFEVKSLLQAGGNEIEIRFASPMQRAQALEAQHGRLPVALESYRVYARKAQYSFGWDWGPKLATSGIWRPIQLEGHRHLRLDHLFAEVQLDSSLQHACVLAKIAIEKFTPHPAELEVEVSGPDFHARRQIRTAESSLVLAFAIEQPRLWWPAGCGGQPLYELHVCARVAGEIEDEQTVRFGIRRLELVREPDAGGESFLFRVNNVPVFCKGADWIPADSFIPRIAEEKYHTLLNLARAAHMNMLRVWGGGIYEQQIFYDLCDELGLMVWQDFMFACGGYPDHPEFVDNVRREVAAVIRQLRNHPCIVLWCGNNENEWLWHMDTRRSYREMPGVSLFEKIIPEICASHDPTRPYWQSSPFGGEDPNSEQQGDRHQWTIWSNWADPAAVAGDRGRFLSEFGFQAPAALSTWRKYLAAEALWPQSPVFEHHNKQVEGPERLFRFLAGHCKMPHDFEDFVFKTQIIQAEALKTMVEHWRREKFHTAGTLFWQLNDCWPAASWAVIDSELQPKAAYWYARRFFAPVLVSFKPAGRGVEVWATNDTLAALRAEFEMELLDFSGQVYWARRESVLLPANFSLRLAAPAVAELLQIDPHRQYLRARLRQNGRLLAENRHFFCRHKHLHLQPPHLAWQLTKIAEQEWEVRVTSDGFVKNLALLEPPAGLTLRENYLDLDANCETVIAVVHRAVMTGLAVAELPWKWLR